jgi:hypothetical protein
MYHDKYILATISVTFLLCDTVLELTFVGISKECLQ